MQVCTSLNTFTEWYFLTTASTDVIRHLLQVLLPLVVRI
jgi:hypothetical protein